MTSRDLTNIIQPPLPPAIPKIDSFPHLQQVRPIVPQQTISLGHVQSHDQNLLHGRQPASNFPRTSRLNSPYVHVDQPGNRIECLFTLSVLLQNVMTTQTNSRPYLLMPCYLCVFPIIIQSSS